jgi:hypothetical protein
MPACHTQKRMDVLSSSTFKRNLLDARKQCNNGMPREYNDAGVSRSFFSGFFYADLCQCKMTIIISEDFKI